ncbi:hypothetical protein [Streptomyces sp. NPDC055085]
MDIPILNNVKRWACPNCSKADITREVQPHTRFHECLGLGGIQAPMVPADQVSSVRVRSIEREDYEGSERGLARDDEGKSIMAVETEYLDGHTDVAVFPGTATANAEGLL